MKLKFSVASLGLLSALAYTQVYADTTYDAKSVISDAQLNTLISTILKIAPSGTKITNLDLRGFFTVNNDTYMTLLDVTNVKFKVTTKIGFIPLTSNVTISLAGTLPGSDCNNPQMTRVIMNGDSSVLDGFIRDHIVKNSASILRDNFIAQSDLVKYCKIKPTPHLMTSDSPFEFTLEPMDSTFEEQMEWSGDDGMNDSTT